RGEPSKGLLRDAGHSFLDFNRIHLFELPPNEANTPESTTGAPPYSPYEIDALPLREFPKSPLSVSFIASGRGANAARSSGARRAPLCPAATQRGACR